MDIRARFSNILFCICAALFANHASASCFSNYQPPVIDTNFQPLSLKFNIHSTTKWDGVNNFSAIDQSFVEEVTITSSFLQTSVDCNNSTYTTANVVSSATSNTTDVSSHFGYDFSPPRAVATLTKNFGGYTNPQQSSEFKITANDGTSVWSSSLNRYIYDVNYTRTISFGAMVEGFSSQQLDLSSYLQSQVGNGGFYYSDLANAVNSNYQILDTYGYQGTATLLSVTTVPLPGTAWLFGSVLLGLASTQRKSKSQ